MLYLKKDSYLEKSICSFIQAYTMAKTIIRATRFNFDYAHIAEMHSGKVLHRRW